MEKVLVPVSCRRKWVFLLLLFIASGTFNLLLSSSWGRGPLRKPPPTLPTELLINTTGCRIPDFPLYDEGTRQLFMVPPPPAPCTKDQHKTLWTQVDWTGAEPRIRILPPVDPGEWKYIHCGYEVIIKGGKNRDWEVNVSALVVVPQQDWVSGFEPKAEFVQVRCYFNGMKRVEYHAFPALANNPRRAVIRRKLDFWRGKKDLPPNILLIGHDSTSRLNFRRHGKELVKFLESVGAHEMKGYIKVAHNTYPNVVPLLSGYSLPEYESACFRTDFQDSCPLLFSKLDQLQYITTYIEDSTSGAIFHYLKRGFSNDTTDFNPRPLELHGQKSGSRCVESSQFLVDYSARVTAFAQNKAPLFAFFFKTFDTHDDIGGLQNSDGNYARVLASLDLSNTVLFVFGDHGYRYNPVAQTMQGLFEGNLPNLWVRLGEKVKIRWPEWETALKENEQRIFSPFNFYATLNKILDSYAETRVPLLDAVDKRTGTVIPRKSFVSFFEAQREDAKCSEIGVPLAYCPCGDMAFISDLDPLVVSGVNFALQSINSELKNFPCEQLSLSTDTTGGGVFMEGRKALLVMFGTNPGIAQIQAKLELRNGIVVKLLHSDRLNRINRTLVTPCFSKLTQWAELFCVCKQ